LEIPGFRLRAGPFGCALREVNHAYRAILGFDPVVRHEPSQAAPANIQLFDFIRILYIALRIVQQYSVAAMPKASLRGDITARRTTRENPFDSESRPRLLILETVGQSGAAVSLGHLATILGIDRSSAFRLANTLKRRGFLTNPSAGKD
jgi:hypothetical protein